jgi:phosphate-selective porin
MRVLISSILAIGTFMLSVEAFAQEAEKKPEGETPLQAGWHGGLFYLRDADDNFRLHFQARAQVDTFNYFGPGVADSGLKSTMFLRRVRPELTGEFMQGKFQWALAGDWGMGYPSTDNAKGKNAGNAQTSRVTAAPTDAYVNWHPSGIFNIQVGQYDVPFTLENRTSDKYGQFMERSLAVRALGVPTNKDIGAMAWGETSNKLFFYSLGIFNGEGQNRPSVDNRADLYGRAFFHPFTTGGGALKDLQIGASFHYGMRDTSYVNYDYPNMSTQGNFTFWSSTYTGTKGITHVIPSGKQLAIASELRLPVGQYFDFVSELVYVDNRTREAIETFQATNSERFGGIKGYAYYAQLGFWPLGGRDINGTPGYENPSHIDFKKKNPEIKNALQLLVKWEQLNVTYDSASQGGTADANNIDGKIKVNAFSVGANYWMTKHLRLAVNYVYDVFPGSAPTKPSDPSVAPQSADQRAIAPGNGLGKGINDSARDTAHGLHEVLFRIAIAL